MIQTPGNKYLETTIQTASSSRLLIMLYDGAIRFCKLGIESIRQKEYEKANINLCKAQDIIQEFIITLDHSSPIAEGLLRLYDYFLFRLMEANTKKAPEPAEEVLSYLVDLKATWIQAASSVSISQPSADHG